MEAKLFKAPGTDLASRRSAAVLRSQIEYAANEGRYVVIDFNDVLSVSESYADELLGVLIADRGLEWFGRNVRVSAPHSVLLSIAAAIKERLVSHEQRPELAGQIHTLLAAKRTRERVPA
jgi:hypothetical protein